MSKSWRDRDWSKIDNVNGVANASILELAGHRLSEHEQYRIDTAGRVRPEDLHLLEMRGIKLNTLSAEDEKRTLLEIRDKNPYVGLASEGPDEGERVASLLKDQFNNGLPLIKIGDYQFIFRAPDVDHIYVEFGNSVYKFATDGRQVQDDTCEWLHGSDGLNQQKIRDLIVENYYTFREKIHEHLGITQSDESTDQ